MDVTLNKKLSCLSLISQKKLENILSSCGDKKDLIIEPSLIAPFERVCGVSWLRSNGIDRIYKLETKITTTSSLNRVYLLPSCLIRLKRVLDHLHGVLRDTPTARAVVLLAPRVLAAHDALLEEEGLAGPIVLRSFRWEFLVLDGILSLELPLYRSVFVEHDTALLASISDALWTLFQVTGKPSLFLSLGKQSCSILEMYDIYTETFDTSARSGPCDSELGALLLMDRDRDYASTLLTPATYTSLLHEVFQVKCGKLELDPFNVKCKQGQLNLETQFRECKSTLNSKTTFMLLDGEADSIFAEIRYRHFSSVFSVLSSRARALNAEGSAVGDLGIHQMKQYVSTKLQQIIAIKRSLANHVLACETIVATLGDKFEDIQLVERSMLNNKSKKSNLSFVEENFCTDVHQYSSLKLLCLLTLTQGVTVEEYNGFVTKYLHAFGYKYLYVFQNLISAGLIVAPTSGRLQLGLPNLASISERLPRWQNNFQTSVNKLNQLPNESESVNCNDPICPSFVYSGAYVPLVAALARIIFQCGNTNDLLAKLSVLPDLKFGGASFDSCRLGVDELGEKLSQMNTETTPTWTELDIGCKDMKVAASTWRGEGSLHSVMPLRPKSLLIFVVGGITQAEVAACHLVEKLTGGRIIVASDCIISGDDLIQSAM